MPSRKPDDYSPEQRVCAMKNYRMPDELSDEDLQAIDTHRMSVVGNWRGLGWATEEQEQQMLAFWREHTEKTSTQIFNRFLIGGSYANT